ncbi:MAG TPA: PadR family transcriptional regulator [Candidatus Polarisedimenticolia bacterium]|nr:PadR family transcriptional regulator [Candidatus Polarisedimenticolia bacterium]
MPFRTRQTIGQREHTVLLAIGRLEGDAYGIRIQREIEIRTRQLISVGAVYATLERLHAKGLVSSYEGDPTPIRGGRAKRFYKIEGPGRRALDDARQALEELWSPSQPRLVL